MNHAWKFSGLACIAAAILAVAGSPLGAQSPQSPAPQPTDPDQKPGAPLDGKRLREIIQRRLDERRLDIDRFEKLLKALDEGKTIEEIREMYPDLQRFAFRGERGGNRAGPDDGVERLGPSMGGMGMGGRPGNAGPGGEAPRTLTPEERQSVREILADTSPWILRHLQDLEKSNPAEADRKFAESHGRLRQLLDTRKRDPKLYEHKLSDIRHGMEAAQAAAAIAALDAKNTGDTADRAKHEAALRDALTAQYNVRTLAIQREAEGLKERAATMAADADKRDAQRGPVIEKNMKTLIEREKKRLERRLDKDKDGRPDHKPDPS